MWCNQSYAIVSPNTYAGWRHASGRKPGESTLRRGQRRPRFGSRLYFPTPDTRAVFPAASVEKDFSRFSCCRGFHHRLLRRISETPVGLAGPSFEISRNRRQTRQLGTAIAFHLRRVKRGLHRISRQQRHTRGPLLLEIVCSTPSPSRDPDKLQPAVKGRWQHAAAHLRAGG